MYTRLTCNFDEKVNNSVQTWLKLVVILFITARFFLYSTFKRNAHFALMSLSSNFLTSVFFSFRSLDENTTEGESHGIIRNYEYNFAKKLINLYYNEFNSDGEFPRELVFLQHNLAVRKHQKTRYENWHVDDRIKTTNRRFLDQNFSNLFEEVEVSQYRRSTNYFWKNIILCFNVIQSRIDQHWIFVLITAGPPEYSNDTSSSKKLGEKCEWYCFPIVFILNCPLRDIWLESIPKKTWFYPLPHYPLI